MDAAEVEHRLTDLEVKLSFAEDTLDRLNEIIVRQQRQIELLTRELLELRDRQPAEPEASLRSLQDEVPPHY